MNHRIFPHLFDVNQRGGVPVKPLQLLLWGQPRRRLATGAEVGGGGGHQRSVEDGEEVPHNHLHQQGLVGVVHQRGQRHLCIGLPRLDQRRAEDDA